MRKNDGVLERPDDPRLPSVRISDDDRQQTVELLRAHCTDGRLTLDEFSDRVGLVYEAKTRGDLDLVTADLPVPTRAPRPPEARRRQPVRSAVAVFSNHRQTGRWRPGEAIGAVAVMGSVDLDLRDADFDHSVIHVNATSIMGSVEIIVPEGMEVELTGLNLMGSKECRVADGPGRGDMPILRVNAFVLMGSVLIRTKRPRAKRGAQGADGVAQSALDRADEAVQRALDGADAAIERGLGRAAQKHMHHQQRMEQRVEQQLQRARQRTQRLGEKFGIEVPAPPASAQPAQPARPARPAEEPDWRDELRSHAAPDGTVTIVFSDMEGYTEMTERLGDLKAREILYAHNQLIREQVAKCGGFEVKSQGDGFMLAFAGASRALRCAVAIQHAFAAYADNHPEEPIRVRMGLHTGEALKEADDFLGRTVIIASRIADEAKGGQVLVSALLKELTDGTGEFVFGDQREVKLKGLTQTYRLYPVEWDEDEA
jgi:class 3 adenylate cyclase